MNLNFPRGLLVGALALFLAEALHAQPLSARNPYTSAADVAAGGQVFRSHCARCHGRAGTGDRGPDLTRGRFRHAASDAGLFTVISQGIPESDMPDLYRSEKTIWQVVAFVRSLSQKPRPSESRGDSESGKALFSGKGGCTKCHMVEGVGGRAGPDLTDIAWLRSPDNLRLSLIEPNDRVHPRWWSVRLTLGDGTILDGIRMDEDTLSVRILDGQNELRAFDKRSLKSFERIEESSMPTYEESLTPKEVEDLVAYMSTLRGQP